MNERKYQYVISTEEFRVLFAAGLYRADRDPEGTDFKVLLYNQAGVGFSMNINDEVEFRVEAALLDGNVSKIVFCHHRN